MNRNFIFKDTVEDEQTHIIDLGYLATGEICKDDWTITLQFSDGIGTIVIDFHTWENCTNEFLRLCGELTTFNDAMHRAVDMFMIQVLSTKNKYTIVLI